MVQMSQILSDINLRLHIAWQPQIRRIWGWLRCSWCFTIPKLRLRLPPGAEAVNFFCNLSAYFLQEEVSEI